MAGDAVSGANLRVIEFDNEEIFSIQVAVDAGPFVMILRRRVANITIFVSNSRVIEFNVLPAGDSVTSSAINAVDAVMNVVGGVTGDAS